MIGEVPRENPGDSQLMTDRSICRATRSLGQELAGQMMNSRYRRRKKTKKAADSILCSTQSPNTILTLSITSLPLAKQRGTSLLKYLDGHALSEVPHLLLVLRHLLFEWFAPSFIIGNLAQRLAFLLTFPDGLSRVAERKDREHRDLLRNAQ